MRTLLWSLAAGVGVAPMLVALAAPGVAAADEGRHVTRDDVTITLDADGTARVVVDLDLDFGGDPGHGLVLTVPHREGTDDGRTRLYEVSDVAASSPSGAPDGLRLEDDGSDVQVYVGDEDVDDVAGTQTYRVEYTVTGLLNPDSLTGAGDQLYWDALGPAFELPVADASVTVVGPADVERVQCYSGEPGTTQPCGSASQDGARATFTQAAVAPGEALTVVVGWPAGTFAGIEPRFEEDAPDTGGSGVAPGFGDVDEGFAGLHPGADLGSFGPGFGGVGAVALIAVIGLAALVAFGVRASRGGGAPPAVVRGMADRGYLRIDRVAGADGRSSWELHRLRAADDLLSPAEVAWYHSIFGIGGAAAWARWADVHAPSLPDDRPHGFGSGVSGSSGFSSGTGFGGDTGGSSGAGGGTGGGGGGAW